MRALFVTIWISAQSAKGIGKNGATEERSDGASASSHVPACFSCLTKSSSATAVPSAPTACSWRGACMQFAPALRVVRRCPAAATSSSTEKPLAAFEEGLCTFFDLEEGLCTVLQFSARVRALSVPSNAWSLQFVASYLRSR